MTEPDRSAGPPRAVLLATDLSARCDRALDRAAALAAAWQAKIVAVHVLERQAELHAADLERRLPSWRRGSDPADAAEKQLRQDLAQVAADAEVVVDRGEPAGVILRVAKDRGCDLIVTGIPRDETLSRLGLGTTVDRLLRRAGLPVLIVRQRAHGPYAEILVATDFSACSRRALQMAAACFPDRKLALFHAYEVPSLSMTGDPARRDEEHRTMAAAECAAFLAEAGMIEDGRQRFGVVLEQGDPAALVPQYVRDHGTDLVVLGTHGRSALADVLLGGTTRAILGRLVCDALLVRAPTAAGREPARQT